MEKNEMAGYSTLRVDEKCVYKIDLKTLWEGLGLPHW
jgi:hypothetical protein